MLLGGKSLKPVTPSDLVVSYEPEWQGMYLEEKRRILEAIGHKVDAIEHIGSTSVPGMKSKPIIDILIAVQDLDLVASCVEPLRTIGYEYRPMNKEIIPDTEYFRKGSSGANTHHIRMVKTGSSLWSEYILFRDYLRNHPEARREYEQLKEAAYEKHGRYLPLDAKRSFIESILAKADSERQAHQTREKRS